MTRPTQVWLVLTDILTTRIFFECQIVERLRERLGDRLKLVVLQEPEWVDGWVRPSGVGVILGQELFPWKVSIREKVARRADAWLERQIGFFPLAIRFNLRHEFHCERMEPGHENWFLDTNRAGPLPRWEWVERAMLRWHLGKRRYTPSALVRRMRSDCAAVVLANLQSSASVPFLLAARRVGRPAIGYVASWDHPVGKGVVSPYIDRYIVQNDIMVDQLQRYHGICPDRIVVTGWPQTDLYRRVGSRDEYAALLRGFGLDAARPVTLFAGNTLGNSPYEGKLVRRLVEWWRDGACERFQLLVRPHPRRGEWPEWFSDPIAHDGLYVQTSSYTDMEDLATVLQHVDCVVANAGTILLDSIVNDRPAVCVLFDEGAPLDKSWAEKNFDGEHYRDLRASGAFYEARSFDEVTAQIGRALDRPGELARARGLAARAVVGEVDGLAATRVADAVAEAVERDG